MIMGQRHHPICKECGCITRLNNGVTMVRYYNTVTIALTIIGILSLGLIAKLFH